MSSYVVPPPCRLPNISQLSPRVWRIMGLNPSPMTLGGTNTFLIGTGRSRILLDCGEGVPEYSQLLQEVVAKTKIESISHLLISHWHFDHISPVAAKQVLDIFPECKIAKAKSNVMPHEKLFPSAASKEGSSSSPVPTFPPSTFLDISETENSVFKTEGATLRSVFTKGHSDDHLCFLLEEEHSVFTGDTILGYGSSVFASFPDFMASLDKIKEINPTRIYPAHGPTPSLLNLEIMVENVVAVGDDVDKEKEQKITSKYIFDYANHRLKRQEQVLNYLKDEVKENEDVDLMTMVEGIYKEQIAGQPKLKMGAAGNTLHILKKLVKEGKVAVDFSKAENLSSDEAVAILDPSKDYSNDVYLARLAASHTPGGKTCSCSPVAQNLLLEKVEKFRWKLA